MQGAAPARWTAALAVLAVLVPTAAGCGSRAAADGGPGVLSSSWGDPQNPLEPANTNEVQGGKVLDMVFRGLKRYDPRTGAAENMLAERIETKDSRDYAVTVKDGWTFSNGEKVTARSFVDAWNYGASLRNNQKCAYFFGYIDGYDKVHPESGKQTADTLSGLKVTGPRTFTVRLNQSFSGFPDTLGYAAFAPLPRAFFEDHAAWLKKPVGNGPYRVKSYVRGAQMSLRTWDAYPGPDKARNRGVDLKVYTDGNTAYTDLMSGNLDLSDDIPAAQLRNVKSDLEGRYVNVPAGILQTLAFPFYDGKWDRPGMEKVRTGLSMAIDREQITRTIFRGTRTPATDWTSPVLGAEGGYRAGLCGDACRYDPQRAKALVKEGAGCPAGSCGSRTTRTPAPTRHGWRPSATPSTTRSATTGPASQTRSAPSPTTATGSARRNSPGRSGRAGRWTTRSSRTSSSRSTTPAPPPTTASGPARSSTTSSTGPTRPPTRRPRPGCSSRPRRSSGTRWRPSRSGTRTAARATPDGSRTWSSIPSACRCTTGSRWRERSWASTCCDGCCR